MNLSDLLDATYERHWRDTRSEHTALANARACVAVLGAHQDAAGVTTSDIDTLVEAFKKRGNAPATINRKLAALSRMFTFAHQRGLVASKPHIERLREPPGRLRWLTRDEEWKLLAAMPGEVYQDLVMVLVDTGLRLSEALGILWQEVDDRCIYVNRSKADIRRAVPMTERVKVVLQRRREDTDERGPFSELTVHQVEHAWRKARKALGLEDDKEFVLHSLRHTFCSRLVQRGVAIQVVQQLAGHRQLSMTLRYAHLAPENLVAAISTLEDEG